MAQRCHWLLLRLALLAALLLAMLPTLGRLAQAASSTASEPIAVCTVNGVQLITAASQPPDGSLLPDQPALHDCAYCPLLAGLLILAVLILRLLQRPPVIRPSIPAPPVANHYRLAGLGPRGPPASL
ncbi:hypothetical protein CO615_09880 [Lysobacteraceae bacterium NML75-0749]|nr:hypothetical protein CO615_09880 [Xanthomonadaceae bacterium NML75-0749]PJK05435.1 hypothetical protein CO609_00225 [Xanthomonadaceae bacterium NML91-0268]